MGKNMEEHKNKTHDQEQDMQQQEQNAEKKEPEKEKLTDCQDIENNLNDCQEKYKELEKKHKDLSDRYLRLAAEYDNYRKRTLKEKQELIKTAGEKVLIDLLPVIDDFERALEHIDKAQDIEALKQGVVLIYNHFQKFLKQQGVEEIDAMDKPLDTDLHEAVQQVPAQNEEQKGKIVHVIQKGYKLNDKVIRHAKVVVAM